MPLVMFGPLGIDIFLPAIPQMLDYFSATSQQIQATITIYLVAVGLGYILVGPLADKFGRRKTAIVGLCIFALSSWMTTLTSLVTELYIVRCIQGMSACASSVAAFAVVRDRYSPTEAAKVYSYLNGMLCLIPAISPLIGGYLTVIYGWQACFLLMAVFALCVCITTSIRLPETNPIQDRSRISYVNSYISILKNTDFLTFSFLNLVGMTCILIYVTYSPLLLMEQLGLNEIAFSQWFGFVGIINIITFLVTPKIIDKIRRLNTVKLGVAFMLTGCLTAICIDFIGLTAAWQFMGSVAIMAIGFSLMLGSSASFALAPFPEKAGAASGLLGCIQLAGGAILTTIAQQTPLNGVQALGYVGAFLSVLCVMVIVKRPEND